MLPPADDDELFCNIMHPFAAIIKEQIENVEISIEALISVIDTYFRAKYCYYTRPGDRKRFATTYIATDQLGIASDMKVYTRTGGEVEFTDVPHLEIDTWLLTHHVNEILSEIDENYKDAHWPDDSFVSWRVSAVDPARRAVTLNNLCYESLLDE